MRLMMAVLLLLATPAANAQTAVPTAAPETDANRLASATQLVEVVMPPALREQMIEQTSGAMLNNMTKAMMTSPQFSQMFEKEPRARPIVERYMQRQGQEVGAMMRDMMPGMMTMMARYYAKRMTVPQLDATRAFYATPTGQVFALAAASAMADPEFARLMQESMAKAMASAPANMRAMQDELKALGPPTAAK